MWIFLNDSFLSIVAHRASPRLMLVRARFPGDIRRVFPTAAVSEGTGTDYRYRASIERREVINAIADQIQDIDYPNFKASILNQRRHDLYMRIWTIMSFAQARKSM
jgi:hypothetical protein